MSTSSAILTPESSTQARLHARFLSMVRGEFVKTARLFWIMLIILYAGCMLGFLLGATQRAVQTDLQHTPLHFLYYTVESNLVIFRILSGIFLLILTSFSIGYEYQYGTIRILLARGAGRVQLLLAKLVMLAAMALLLLVLFILLLALLICVQLLIMAGNLHALSAITPAFWSNSGIDVFTVAFNMLITILLAAAMNALGRSLTIGLSASLLWFPLDNFASPFTSVLAQLLHNDFWLNLSAYLLGPLLNRLPEMLLPKAARTGFEAFGLEPMVHVSGSHALWVGAAYALVFLVLALIPTWKRDIKE
ncbi:hypothetical protein EPA93_12200 [Ktedonosporobacter rubrisoli]|uniref:Uncharacterized protein n=1 Tax=Ktedonosporobacter rubrisoli TaxID=2509675 RepID=A0A4P6JN80_KTERU|nr:ABC transporter permease [Ktedonosporobacter rubrisoli]QBD76724.1 hypothetical protein EPA93_12200 [Ktedonosporobacter rubrisoli]